MSLNLETPAAETFGKLLTQLINVSWELLHGIRSGGGSADSTAVTAGGRFSCRTDKAASSKHKLSGQSAAMALQ